MRILVPKEMKTEEARVSLVPDMVSRLVEMGHTVMVQRHAGLGSGFSNEDYLKQGAILVPCDQALFRLADMVVKVKEPLPDEYHSYREGQTLFTYLHLSGSPQSLTDMLLEKKMTGIGYETVERKVAGRTVLPLLSPMSRIAGQLAVEEGLKHIPYPAHKVVILGGGNAGASALEEAIQRKNLSITIFDKDEQRRRALFEMGAFRGVEVSVMADVAEDIAREVKNADLLIGTINVPGNEAPKIVTEAMVQSMKAHAVIVDVAIDQGGCIWGSRPQPLNHPTYRLEDKTYFCVPNMPSLRPQEATMALTTETFPYLCRMLRLGVEAFAREDPGFAKGIQTYQGHLTHKGVADHFQRPYTPLDTLIS